MTAMNPDGSQQAVVEAALVLLERMGLIPADLAVVPQDRLEVPTFAVQDSRASGYCRAPIGYRSGGDGVGLLLQAAGFAGPLRWRWLLSDEDSGRSLADHTVDLDPASDDVAALNDLYGYVRWHTEPDRRVPSEAAIVTRTGIWTGRVVLGETIGREIIAASPVTVRVMVPARAQFLLQWPLELSHVDGAPLSARGDVTFVYDLRPGRDDTSVGDASDVQAPSRPKDPVTGALRMLAVFSLPASTGVLALRQERYELSRLIRRIAARERRAVELRVAQYGVTREKLAGIADDGDGWDVLHLSGHGRRGSFLLENADGSADSVNAADLVKLLRPTRRRVKLAVVSACESAVPATAETLRWIGGLPVDAAVMRAVVAAAGPEPTMTRPAISLATPGLFGARAVGLVLPVPRGRPNLDPAEARMEHFPGEPSRFVGRAAVMAQASAALAPESGRTAVLLHGMAGAGKTACALELAYRHQDSFAVLAFWQAPSREEEFGGALGSLAKALEIQLGYGFAMTSHIGSAAELEALLPAYGACSKTMASCWCWTTSRP
jgi:CHAT domain